MPLKVSDGIGAWIKDFKKSDAPQFKGKSAKERQAQAVAAYLSAKRGPLKKENVKSADKNYEIWINHFSMEAPKELAIDIEKIKQDFAKMLAGVWYEEIENDALNKLIVISNISCDEVKILRSYLKYLQQINFIYDQNSIISTLERNYSLR